MPLVEELAYGITRGALRAWLEYQATLLEVTEEVPSDAAKERAAAFRAAVARMSEQKGYTERSGSAQTSKPSNG